MKRVITIVGARPQFIKAACISRAFGHSRKVTEILVHTGQHFDPEMSEVFFTELQLARPQYHLNIHGGLHGEMTGRMMQALEEVLVSEEPSAVLVYGDTNSTLAGALAAAKLNLPVAHVEAGLRSYNRRMPEEINRIVTDHISTWLFTPTVGATENLAREGIVESADASKNSGDRMMHPRVVHTGDVMYDAALFYSESERQRGDVLAKYGLESKGYILATIHRAENTDAPQRLRSIMSALRACPKNS